MSDTPEKPNKVSALKELLLDTLADQIENGVTVIDKEGVEHTVDVGAPTLAVAAKVIKDWAGDIDASEKQKATTQRLSQFLAERRPDIAQGPKPN